jgi:hypothetical protein
MHNLISETTFLNSSGGLLEHDVKMMRFWRELGRK